MALAMGILCIGVATFLMRLSFVGVAARYRMPPMLERALRYVPPAVLVALIVPDLVAHSGGVDLSLGNARLWAGTLAILVAWRTRNIPLTLAVGMGTLWALTALAHG
jgi:branched-subunit amino acid transport protein